MNAEILLHSALVTLQISVLEASHASFCGHWQFLFLSITSSILRVIFVLLMNTN